MARKWLIAPPAPDLESKSRAWGVPPILVQLLLNRGLSSREDARRFLSPRLRELDPPHTLPGAERAAAMLVDALARRRRIVLYGDYDVDGITGVSILWHVLTRAGGNVGFYVPHRVEEGYGLNPAAVARLAEEGAELLVSVDCGITACEPARTLRERGVPLIITDHHTPPAELPHAEVIVHPTVGGKAPNPNLCGAGVAFKLAWAVAQRLGDGERADATMRELLMDLLPLAALGTIADVVPLVGENRIIACHGLERLPRSPLPGVQALIESAGLDGDRIDGYDVGFKLAPRLNAAGRMGHARLAVELFTRADARRAREIALYLEEHNGSRQAVERRITRQAVEMIEAKGLAGDARRAIVLASEKWHPGVVGIVAARLVERYHRPVVLIAVQDGVGQGSGRSIAPFHMSEALSACAEHLADFGGHAMAGGLKIDPPRIPAFTEAFIAVANNRLTGDDLVKKVRIEAEVELEELALPTVEAITRLGPFGEGNPRPRLATGWLELAGEPRCIGKTGAHLDVRFRRNGTTIRAIGFGMADRIEDLRARRRCRAAFEPMINTFHGRKNVEMRLLDLQFPPDGRL